MSARLAIAFLIGIPVLWACWLAYKLAELAVLGWYWIRGERT